MEPQNTLSMIRENLNPDVWIVRNPADDVRQPGCRTRREACKILQENFGDLVFETKIRKTVRYAEAPVKGTSVLKT